MMGKDNKQIYVKHGGTFVRVNPCHVRKVNDKCISDVTESVKDLNLNRNVESNGNTNQDENSIESSDETDMEVVDSGNGSSSIVDKGISTSVEASSSGGRY